ncbi:hypothetical protein AVEN_55716-1, partial [Araneus ventricosus]
RTKAAAYRSETARDISVIHWERRPDSNDTPGVGKYVRGIALKRKAISDSPDSGRNQSVIAMATLSHFVEQMARVVEKYPPFQTADMFFPDCFGILYYRSSVTLPEFREGVRFRRLVFQILIRREEDCLSRVVRNSIRDDSIK